MSSNATSDPVNSQLLATNVLWSLLGQVLPLLVAVVTIPPLLEQLGADRFGVLTIAWLLVGYFGLFDLGLGRALTKIVAQYLGTDRRSEVPPVVWTGLAIMLATGFFFCWGVHLFTPRLASLYLKLPTHIEAETLESASLIAISLPFVVLTAGLRGVLEAYQRFVSLSVVRGLMGASMFLGPLMAVQIDDQLSGPVLALVIARIFFCVWHAYLCAKTEPLLVRQIVISKVALSDLFAYAKWITLTNLVGPVMVNMDRLVLGATISVAAVAYYATPHEIITKLGILPAGIVAVIFPVLAATLTTNPDRAGILFAKTARYLGLLVFPVVLLICGFSYDIMSLWVGESFAFHSANILKALTIGVYLNCLAQVPSALIQASGRPDINAKLHVLELPLYLLMLFGLMDLWGVLGVAIAWSIRASIDAVALFSVAAKILPGSRERIAPTLPAVAVSVLALLAVAGLHSLAARVLGVSVIFITFVFYGWFKLLTDSERFLCRSAPARLGDLLSRRDI